MSYCKMIAVGNMTKDPEARTSGSGTKIASFTVASNYKKGQEECCNFISCTAFGKTAEYVLEYLAKGKKVLVEGRVNTDTWDDKQTGQPREKMVLIVENVQNLSPKEKLATVGADSENPF